MKKICFFLGDVTKSGGTERVSVMIANELAVCGKYEVCILSLCEQCKAPFYTIHKTIKRYKLGDKWLQPGPGYLPLIPKLRHFLKEQRIDLILDVDIVLDVLSIPASWGIKTKVLSWEHFNCDYEMSMLYRRCILKFSVKHSDYVITLTEGDRKTYGKRTGRTKNIEAIYNPMKMEDVVDAGEKENWIITAVRLVYDKGIDFLAETAAEVLTKHPDWKWYVLGEGEERRLLEEAILKNGLEGRLIAPGLVSNVGEYLDKAKMFVLTSRVEGLPMCLIEAKAHDLPCISFDIATGPSEVIEHGVNGYLIEPFDVDDMILKVNALIENDKLQKQFQNNAKNDIEKFQMKDIMEKWNRVIDSLCG